MKCIICGSENIETVDTVISDFVMDRITDDFRPDCGMNRPVKLCFCRDCTFAFYDYRITDELIAEDVIVYAISGTEIGNVISYIRINIQNDSAEIEKIQTNEITNLSFQELMERQVSFRDLMEK